MSMTTEHSVPAGAGQRWATYTPTLSGPRPTRTPPNHLELPGLSSGQKPATVQPDNGKALPPVRYEIQLVSKWQVGHYGSDGRWTVAGQYDTREQAEARVRFLEAEQATGADGCAD